MGKDQNAVKLGRRGGQATLAKHGLEHFRALGRASRKPDSEVSPHALYKRQWRANKQAAVGVLVVP